jgi:hypothetical protein
VALLILISPCFAIVPFIASSSTISAYVNGSNIFNVTGTKPEVAPENSELETN